VAEESVLGTLGEDVLVESPGLKAGDAVVVRGNERLRPGMSVRVQGGPEAPAESSNGAPAASGKKGA